MYGTHALVHDDKISTQDRTHANTICAAAVRTRRNVPLDATVRWPHQIWGGWLRFACSHIARLRERLLASASKKHPV